MSTENLSAAIASLQSAEEACVTATETIETHNVNTEAHPDIRELIEKIYESDAIYTRAQIDNIVVTKVDTHANTDFQTAHPGWSTWEATLETRLTTIETKLSDIQDYIDGKTSDESTLSAKLQVVEDKYAPIISNLQEAYQAAVDAGNTTLAEQYKTTIQSTLDQKTTELLAVMTEWQSSQS